MGWVVGVKEGSRGKKVVMNNGERNTGRNGIGGWCWGGERRDDRVISNGWGGKIKTGCEELTGRRQRVGVQRELNT